MPDETDRLILKDEEGNDHEFSLLDIIEVGDDEYAILAHVGDDENEAVAFRLETDEVGQQFLVDIDDDEEWERVAQTWESHDHEHDHDHNHR